ncbi:MAG: hypothetical protein NZZ60_07675 [Bacteroidia bacterium]|nr:hypothetical protein [Bacteroidia bacterium]MCX7652669.1 hypothetical protein [Bacteroidia bacterium]MDW8416977.1 hypothetical protein [Bacteroidia bacterium]
MRCAYFLLALILPWSCVRKPQPEEAPPQPAYRGLFILNEGQWTLGNASLDVISTDGTYYADVFYAVNRQPLGDVANHILRQGDTLWITMNGSRVIWKVLLPSVQALAKIVFPSTASPREFLPITPHKAYVNSLLDSAIYRIDLRNMAFISPPIRVENFSESMLYHSGRVWVTCGSYAYPLRNWKVACIDPVGDSVLYYLALPRENPGPIESLPSGEILVGCRGNYADQKGMLVHINPSDGTISRTVGLSTSVYLLRRYGEEIFLLTDSGITRYDWRSGQVDYSFLTKGRLGIPPHELLYGFFYDSTTNEWVLANAKAGGVRGELLFIRNDSILRRRSVGVFPSKFVRYP